MPVLPEDTTSSPRLSSCLPRCLRPLISLCTASCIHRHDNNDTGNNGHNSRDYNCIYNSTGFGNSGIRKYRRNPGRHNFDAGDSSTCGNRLFISAFMLSSEIICDDTNSNKSWCIVGQGMFALREINQMERELCSYLEWQLNVDPSTLRDFPHRVQQDLAGPGPYPPMVLPQPAPFTHQSSSNASSSSGSAMPLLPPPRAPMPKDAPVIPSPSIPSYPSSPPDTPEASHSASTSPASSVLPQTPPDAHGPGFPIKVVSADSSPVGAPVIPHGTDPFHHM